MNSAGRPLRALLAPRLAFPCALLATVVLAHGCTENLPSGPNTFSATLSLVNLPDTLVVADSRVVEAHVTDAAGHLVEGLSFSWALTDTTVAKLGTPDTSAGRSRTILARHGGLSRVTLSLTDSRFTVPNVFKQLTVVLGGVRIATSHDTTIASINDTAVAVGAGLVKAGGTYVPGAAQGIRWTHKGVATTGAGQGDSLRYVAKANGVDTLIASVDFCLAGARCADTAYVRVTQSVKLALSAHAFNAWSVGDSVGPSITLTDKRGNGLAGATVRFVPVALADSQIVSVTAPIGSTNPVTGLMAAPQLVAAGNGTARTRVLAVRADGSTADVDSVTAVVRQVARRVAVEPFAAQITEVDSMLMNPNARDARGHVIADATLTVTPTLVDFVNGRVIGVARGGAYLGSVLAALTGAADPANNPAAPQVPYTNDGASVSVTVADSAVADTSTRVFHLSVLSAPGVFAVGQWVRFFASGGVAFPDSAQADASGQVIGNWAPPNTSQRWTFSAMLAGAPLPLTAADSTGRLLLRRSIFVKPATPLATLSTATVPSAVPHLTIANITVTVRDAFGNVVTSALPAQVTFATTAPGGFVGAGTCVLGLCTYPYNAPPAAGSDSITISVLGVPLPAPPNPYVVIIP
ncbi:MAG: hypothetical protein ACHQQ3_14425 [Gemmatimonadales bacterium]